VFIVIGDCVVDGNIQTPIQFHFHGTEIQGICFSKNPKPEFRDIQSHSQLAGFWIFETSHHKYPSLINY
jgi:hypothetical protein